MTNIRIILTSAAGTMGLTTQDCPEIRDTLAVVWRVLESAGDGTLSVGGHPPKTLEARVEDERGELPYLEARAALRQWVGLPEQVTPERTS